MKDRKSKHSQTSELTTHPYGQNKITISERRSHAPSGVGPKSGYAGGYRSDVHLFRHEQPGVSNRDRCNRW